ncbi:MAG: biopolymer transporter ExbD [Sulfurimonas sp. RIFCSPHIGHO2_12_FULL_36_9]|jgi:biopolymer transport protein ExbD|uniref:ExbD/TolR family protein n=1 Tax=unclassified Sulfurimonas TaxID=2623549 RepID=UPI0008B1A6DB|nr:MULTISPECIES: biopolymer transporter ExbD [unclassified Sulfurimonas]OHD97675.1 MAG: biopolymer transporter ExbD [Sulfurimonas sp. RIFCSPHIGHO2_12_FULL_36_9]OHD98100.1 MAG: biopolymer transporter ExbD [Sulfurimonas sp. RIFCSPLOWO2_02_FULL_36_28]OHE01624.1 MAG: biopolymer transporter ExbD [Sulfurimonas sp. RIFCSPLOWO2_12_36_12]OHE03108.1 MAG: biopolymer transporter ExbD [Sulfurimonas sp. RIFCSPLOWO2_12_FULL_36_74]
MAYDWDEKPELNITPLVDVMLVLLAIMMVIAPTMIYEEKIALPQSSKTKSLTKIPPVHITVDKDKNLKVNKDNFEFNAFLDNFFLYSKKLDLKATVLISADKNLDYGVVMSVLAAVKQAGFVEVSLATDG